MNKKLKINKRSSNKSTSCCCKNANSRYLRYCIGLMQLTFWFMKIMNELHPHFWSSLGSGDWLVIKEVISAYL